ncbi:MAG: MFS transporter [Candidatus Aminicenantes bacterium]|nr:MFS transporter [Candidatus Aminicenantes bacterium]MBL7083364.1 MFS transporter [Candidatus Aminicenantes bacterium]
MESEEKIVTIWNKNFIVALFGFFFLFMSVTLFFLFPLFLEQFNPSKSQIGMVMGIHSLTAIFIRPFFGRLIDIKGRKKISLFGIVFLILVLPCFHLIHDAGLLPVILRALTGIGWGISMTATITICSDLAPVERLAHSMGIIGVAGLISCALGPLLAEEIISRFGFSTLFNTSLIFLIVSFLCMLSTKESIRPNNSNQFYKSKPLWGISIVTILLISMFPIAHGAARGAVVHFIALFGKSIPLDRVGPFFLSFSGAAILTRLGIGGLSDKYGRKQILFPAACIVGFNLFLISQISSSWLFVLTGFIGGFGQGLIFPALSTYIIDILGRENKGLALSLYLAFFDIGMGFGSVFFGWISDLYGYRKMYLFAGIVFFLVAVIFTWKAPSSTLKLVMKNSGEP